MSVLAGCALAIGYQLFASYSHRWLSFRSGKAAPLLAVGSMLFRLTLVGATLILLATMTPLEILPMAIAFVALFTLLGGLELARFAQGKGPLHPTTHAD